jgi:hypothetical protein
MSDAANTTEASMDTKTAFTAHAAEITAEIARIESQDIPRQAADAIAEIKGQLAQITAQDAAWWRNCGEYVSQIIIANGLPGITPISKTAEVALHGIQRRKGQY